MCLAAEQVQSMKKIKIKTALGWWTECLHSYLMSYYFSELEEMGGVGWGESGCECTAQCCSRERRPCAHTELIHLNATACNVWKSHQAGRCSWRVDARGRIRLRLENEEKDEEFWHFDTSQAITASVKWQSWRCQKTCHIVYFHQHLLLQLLAAVFLRLPSLLD